MTIKWKTIFFDLMIIMVTGILIAVVVNRIRADRIPMLPPYMDNSFYGEMKLSTFQQKEFKSSRCLIFDARPHKFYEKNHLTMAMNFPVSEFDFFYHLYLDHASKDVPIFVYGRTLSRAYDLELAHRLSLMGHKNVTVIF